MITADCISKVKDASLIDDVVGRFTTITRKGQNFTGLCPFHNEKTPSFHVNIVKQSYKCFGCGKSGDAIKFLMEFNKYTYPEAIKWLAEFYNIALEYENETEESKNKREKLKSEKQKQSEAIAFAHNLYSTALHKLDDKHPGWQYLFKRGFTREKAMEWHLGIATLDNKVISSNGINSGHYQGLLETGVIKTTDGITKDFFCNRIIIPIHNANGKLISLAGRSIPSGNKALDEKFGSTKYLNLCDSIIYQKKEVLFGLYQAITAKAFSYEKNRINVVEGYLDVISCQEAGAHGTVGTCGTSITEEQIKLIAKYSKYVNLWQDGNKTSTDENGTKKVNRSGEDSMIKYLPEFLKHDLTVYVIDTPGQDPDEYAQEFIKSLK